LEERAYPRASEGEEAAQTAAAGAAASGAAAAFASAFQVEGEVGGTDSVQIEAGEVLDLVELQFPLGEAAAVRHVVVSVDLAIWVRLLLVGEVLDSPGRFRLRRRLLLRTSYSAAARIVTAASLLNTALRNCRAFLPFCLPCMRMTRGSPGCTKIDRSYA